MDRAVPEVDPRTSLALWLRAGRSQRKLSLDDVARITKIQPRILEKLEAGHLDGLPAEVFVRGFVRSFARCVGLDEGEALERLGACQPASPVARAYVETMVDGTAPSSLARKIEVVEMAQPTAVAPVEPVIESIVVIEPVAAVEVAVAVEPAEPAKKKRAPRQRTAKGTNGPPTPRKRKPKATPIPMMSTGEQAAPAIVAPIVDGRDLRPAGSAAEGRRGSIDPIVEHAESAAEPMPELVPSAIEIAQDATWQPTMPPVATTRSVPWRRPYLASSSASPSLVLSIDDADPERAEREQADREAAKDQRVSFLPPILLDREDRSARHLTLAVIILLIAATLTLSYLMRRPSASGDGVTMADVPSMLA